MLSWCNVDSSEVGHEPRKKIGKAQTMIRQSVVLPVYERGGDQEWDIGSWQIHIVLGLEEI